MRNKHFDLAVNAGLMLILLIVLLLVSWGVAWLLPAFKPGEVAICLHISVLTTIIANNH